MEGIGDLLLFISALGADTLLVQSNSAQGAAVNLAAGGVFLGGGIDAAGKGELGNIQLILQQIINNLDHAFHGHGLLGDNQAAFRVSSGQLRLEGGALHFVGGGTVTNALSLVDTQNGGQKRIVLSQNQCMVKVLQHFPCGLLDFVTGKNHIDTGLHSVLDLDGQKTGMTMKVLCFTFESIETVCVLQV